MRHTLIAALFTATALVAPALAADPAKLDTRSVTLRDLGYPDGVTLSGIAARQDIFFPLPAWVPTDNLKLDMKLGTALADGQRASVQLLLDDQPRWAGALKPGMHEQTITAGLKRTDLRQAFTKATIAWGAQWSDNRCVDQRLPGGFVTLSPDSAVTYSIDPAKIDSVRAAWSALGPRVSIFVSAEGLSETQFQAVTRLAAALIREGRRVNFVRIPSGTSTAADANVSKADLPPPPPWPTLAEMDTGSVFVASRAEIEGFITLMKSKAGPEKKYELDTNPGADIGLLKGVGSPSIALLDGIDGEKVRFLTDGWSPLADMTANTINAAKPQPASIIGDDGIPFATLGLGQGVQELVDRAEWPLRLDYTQVPQGQRPAALEIELAPGSTVGDRPQLLHVFVNNTLLRSVSLPDGGKVQRISVPLPDGLLGRSNAIRIVLQRQPSGGDCREAPLASPAQILPGSRVTLTPDSAKPADFYALSPAMAKGATLVVTADQLKDVAAVNLAARVVADLVPAQAPLSVIVGDGKAKPATPFIQLPGASLPGKADLPVRLDGGAVSVKDRSGQTLLDVSGTHGLITAQLAGLDDTPGLSLATSDGTVPAGLPRLSFDKGNVAFADQTGVLMAFDTVRDRAVRVVVADDNGWADWLDRFRILLVLGAWGLLTLVGVGALRRWYRNRTPKA
ncbi:cellulose biosynthesis cyclic di-GMP-binding regulatory protein BcsB [Niveispirillum sp.]|uniref:cellulose biosynthesis cyclic di-GMP-binding regulatory protein BcsB n=1 Tax=Niveispirillum sp. TaxID=1917217 RepID=UPI001B52FF12|nr:cellulose biosynthesis cyclic di-GMP-binding regulatory protein BcsB [Niveispirillum sp.]MBP7339881.1 cellulose biosynthesis cyclic di-GMP-binding regulatory protein BcsB [Niveispirillum sp.]